MKKLNDRLIAGIFTAYGLEEEILMRTLKIIVEKHPDGYVAYPLGLKGVVVAEGDTYEEALAEVKSAVQFHIETFGNDAFENNDVVETFVAEVAV
ncbi:type II toxin-antitoxin system HicB family antitoxin [Methanoculleus oceani]|nr:type II toxin-antitoxin system HicB family antitoxin [Methanoculleus sp. CWC-02]